MSQCPECGQEVDEQHNFCGNCGTPLAHGETDVNESPTASESGDVGEPADDEVYEEKSEDDVYDDPPMGESFGSQPKRLELTVGVFWVPIVLGVLGLMISLYYAIYPETLFEQMVEAEAPDDITPGQIEFAGYVGVLLSLALFGLAYFYYNEGYLDKRYFGVLIALGILGFFMAANPFLLVLFFVGAYGLYKTW